MGKYDFLQIVILYASETSLIRYDYYTFNRHQVNLVSMLCVDTNSLFNRELNMCIKSESSITR